MPIDNRNIHANDDLISEIENDTTPIDEGENPKDNPEDKEEDVEIEDTSEEESNPTPDADEEDKSIDDEEISDEDEIDEETGEIKKKTPPEKTPERNLPDVEERLAEQRREATILHEKNKQLSDAFVKANEIKDPTEEELREQARRDGFNFDDLTDFERVQFKKNLVNERKLQILNEVGSKVTNIDQWAQDVDKFLDDNETNQTNKALFGKEGAFRAFCMKQSHRGVNMSLLVSAFLHDAPKDTPKHKGSLMLTRTGGERVEKKNNLKDAEYVQNLRKSNPREYQRLLKTGKINIEI